MFIIKKLRSMLSGIVKSEKFNSLFSPIAFAGAVVFAVAGNFIKRLTSKAVRVSVVAGMLVLCVSAVSVAYAMEYNTAIAVFLNGEKIGYVRDSASAKAVQDSFSINVHGDTEGKLQITFNEELRLGNVLEANVIFEQIINKVGCFNTVSGLYVDGDITAYAESSNEIVNMLGALIRTHTDDGAIFKGYANNVEIKTAYVTDDVLLRLVDSVEGFLDGRSGVQIMTSRVETYDEEVPYYTQVSYDESHTSGYNRVVKRGKNGKNRVTADVIYINGNRAGEEIIAKEIVIVPKDAKVVRGMCEEAIESIRLNYAGDSKVELMTFPCEITKSTYISSYWGDGRNHKGVDIASLKGSEIYAAAEGVVSFSGVNGAYGKCIIIDHPDGKTQTLYAHNSSNLVKKGDKVTEGQVIAKVGSTGKSTGNHLHFSVLVNGKHVNPEKYLGLD